MPRLLFLIVLLAAAFFLARWFLATLRSVPPQTDSQPDDSIGPERGAIPGESPQTPISVSSPVLVEPAAAETPCVRCGGEVRAGNHSVRFVDGVSLRVVPVGCKQCGDRREMFFQIEEEMLVN